MDQAFDQSGTERPGMPDDARKTEEKYGYNRPVDQAAYDAGEVCEEGNFSGSSCDSCNSHMAGDRHAAHLIRDNRSTGGEFECCHASICADCLMFHANGDEPESWEA